MLCVLSGRRGSLCVFFPISSLVTGAGFASSDCVGSKGISFESGFSFFSCSFFFSLSVSASQTFLFSQSNFVPSENFF